MVLFTSGLPFAVKRPYAQDVRDAILVPLATPTSVTSQPVRMEGSLLNPREYSMNVRLTDSLKNLSADELAALPRISGTGPINLLPYEFRFHSFGRPYEGTSVSSIVLEGGRHFFLGPGIVRLTYRLPVLSDGAPDPKGADAVFAIIDTTAVNPLPIAQP